MGGRECMTDRQQNIVETKAHKKSTDKKCVAYKINIMVKEE